MTVKIHDVTHDRALEIASELQNSESHTTTATLVMSGTHPELGDIHVVMPAMGASIVLPALLPVVVQGLSL